MVHVATVNFHLCDPDREKPKPTNCVLIWEWVDNVNFFIIVPTQTL